MKRVFVYLSAVVGLGGMLYLAGVSHAQPPMGAPPAGAPAASPVRPTIAVFNMAAVMRDYKKAKLEVYKLNKKRLADSAKLMALQGEAKKLQVQIPAVVDPVQKDKMQKELINYGRAIQDEQARLDKDLNDEASKIISKLYDEIKMVVDKTAEMNVYHIVFAYPDAVTPEEQANPYLKELKLKPPAAQPFFVAPQVDITGVVVKTLNGWFPPVDERGQPVDVDKLPPLEPTAAPGAATPAGAAVPMAPPGVPMGPVPGKP